MCAYTSWDVNPGCGPVNWGFPALRSTRVVGTRSELTCFLVHQGTILGGFIVAVLTMKTQYLPGPVIQSIIFSLRR